MADQQLKLFPTVNTEMMKGLAIDYVVNDIGWLEICRKYSITQQVFSKIVDYLDLKKKKDDYRRKILDKALDKLAEKQSTTLAKTVKILLKQVEAVDRVQTALEALPIDENDRLKSLMSKVLDSDTVNDIMKIFMIMVKEQRLENGKPTDSVVSKVLVEMVGMNAVFSRPTAPIDVTPQQAAAAAPVEPPKVEEQKPQPTEDIKVEVDASIGMAL